MRAVIIAHGSISDYAAMGALLLPGDRIIAADGGALHVLKMGRKPHVIIGDLDSLDNELAMSLEVEGTRIIRYPKEKDETDTHLALEYALSLGVKEIIMLGMLGDRLDHSLGNLLLPFHVSHHGTEITIQDEVQDIVPLVSGRELFGKKGDTFSLINFEDIKGLNITGAKYPLKNENIDFGSTRTISNEFAGARVVISWREGSRILLVRVRG